MQIAVIADKDLKAELLSQTDSIPGNLNWIDDPSQLSGEAACIDLLFPGDAEWTHHLLSNRNINLFINDPVQSADLPGDIVRFNGWKTFLERKILEAGFGSDENRKLATQVFALFNKTIEWTPGQPGFISARVVSMIINEAFFALGEKVSTREEIDIAMKMGTNYPYGPFEWAGKIGIGKVHSLLSFLSASNDRYTPAPLLTKEASLK